MGKILPASVIYEDRDEGLVGSLAIYIGALAAVVLVLGTPVYLLNMPKQTENHGMAAYAAPPGTQLIPGRSARIVMPDSSLRTRLAATKTAPR